MSESPTYKKFVPVSGYKDVFYNPTCSINTLVKKKDKSPLSGGTDNLKPSKRKNTLTNNLRIDVEIQDWTNGAKNVRPCVTKEPEILGSPFKMPNPVFSHRQTILNKRNLNSKKTLFVFPTPKSYSESDERENIYKKIKEQMLKIISEDSIDKKLILADSIIKLFQDANIDEQKLSNFMENL